MVRNWGLLDRDWGNTTVTGWACDANDTPTVPVCSWSYLYCTNTEITRLTLSVSGLGQMPNALGYLTSLKWLDLSMKLMAGTIPSTLGSLTNLLTCRLNSNSLTGTIPSSLGDLSSLTTLQLYGNCLQGSIPSELGLMTTLKQLYLRDNRLTGPIPLALSNLSSLETLSVFNNDLDVTYPAELCALLPANVLYLYSASTDSCNEELVEQDKTMCEIAEAWNLTADDRVDGWKCNTNGQPSNASGVCDWTGVTCSDGHVRELSPPLFGLGIIPEEISSLTAMQHLAFQDAGLTGTIPDSLHLLSELQILDLHGNNLQGPLPVIFAKMSSLQTLSVFGNMLEAEGLLAICDELKESHVASLEVYFYQASDSCRDLAEQDKTMCAIAEAWNLTAAGAGDDEATRVMGWKCNAEGRPFSGVGGVCNWTAVTCHQAIVYAIGSDPEETPLSALLGIIPAAIGNLTGLVYLVLPYSGLRGSIPSSIGELSLLQYLVLSGNQLTGSIPSEIGQLSSLRSLFCHENFLSGNLPSSLGSLTSLQDLMLHFNSFSSSIPPSLGDLDKLEDLRLYYNHFSGTIPPELGKMSSLVTVDRKSVV